MAFVPLFSFTQAVGTPQNLDGVDLSTGTDVLITSRRIYLEQADGTFLVPAGVTTDYIPWPLPGTTITISDILTQDTALSITVEWLNSSNVAIYDKTTPYGFDAYGQSFFYGLSDGETPIVRPPVALSTNYFQNKMQFMCYLVSAAQAITRYGDVYKAQIAYDLDQFMISNQNDYFS